MDVHLNSRKVQEYYEKVNQNQKKSRKSINAGLSLHTIGMWLNSGMLGTPAPTDEKYEEEGEVKRIRGGLT